MATALEEKTSTGLRQNASAVIRVEDIRHSYGKRTALKGISFDVAAGEIFGLLGPNGSGKTTLFRILSTLMLPTSGRALVSGFDSTRQPDEVRRRIGVVFQSKSVDLKLTAAENLWHQGHLYGLRGATLKSRIQEMLERVALADRAKDKVETFSGGMQRRVELAKGLMHRPSVLLLDEPTTGLDPGARRDLWIYLDQLRAQESVSIIVTTHLMEEAEHCDRLAILNLGEIVGLGTPAELRSQIGGDVVVLEASDSATLRSEEHTSELQSHVNLVCRLLLEKKKKKKQTYSSQHQNYTKLQYTSAPTIPATYPSSFHNCTRYYRQHTHPYVCIPASDRATSDH